MEFSLVALPFLFMIFAILELALIFVLDSVLDNATIETGRLVRTGQADAQSMTKAQFKTSLCGRMSIFASDCDSRVFIDVRVIPQFDEPLPDPIVSEDKDGVRTSSFNEADLDYSNGEPGDLVVVRVWYKQPLITTFLAQALPRLDNGTALLTATTAFRNEPA